MSILAIIVVIHQKRVITDVEKGQERIMPEENMPVSGPGVRDLAITVVYNNNPCGRESASGWGFSAILTGAKKNILFDTGPDSSLLSAGRLAADSMETLEIDPKSIDVIVLSHIHSDHSGGLGGFLEKNANVTIYLPESFPKKFKDRTTSTGANTVEVKEHLEICENVYSTGQLGKRIKEQSLIIRTEAGMIIMAGCAHPGILNIVKKARDLIKDDILLVMGGFHLEWARGAKIEKIISAFDQWGVRYVGPCHCCGHKARSAFEKHFGKNYINACAGTVINLSDLQ